MVTVEMETVEKESGEKESGDALVRATVPVATLAVIAGKKSRRECL
jgi:hypothetical protein